jgi:hypothetical protein
MPSRLVDEAAGSAETNHCAPLLDELPLALTAQFSKRGSCCLGFISLAGDKGKEHLPSPKHKNRRWNNLGREGLDRSGNKVVPHVVFLADLPQVWFHSSSFRFNFGPWIHFLNGISTWGSDFASGDR